VTRHVVFTLVVAGVAIGLSFLAPQRRGALIGSSIASFTAVGSILAMGRFSRAAAKPVHRAVAVMTVAFLVRLVLVGVATALVYRAGESVIAFIIAFFIPYFVFSAIEGAYVHALGRHVGPTA
jgi:hypothetical protein